MLGEEDFKSKYLSRLNKELGVPSDDKPIVSSHAYEEFKVEYIPKHLSLYEKLCKFSGKALKVSPSKKKADEIQKAIEITHLNVTPADITSFSLLAPLVFILVGSLLGYVLPGILSAKAEGGSTFMVSLALIFGLVLIYPLQRMPFYLSNAWRMKASNQMVLAIFYMVTYMRHTSNLELAVDFAAEHLSPPLSLDLKKVIWDIETNKFDSVKASLDSYLETWKDWNKEFIESIHLIESSLYENSESRRINALDKALSVMLNETYEKMLHYAHNLRGPLEALHMLGIVLPILGLVILPLMVSFVPEVEWFHIMIVYNIIFPVLVYYMGKNIMSRRPTGYGETNISDDNPELKKYKNIIIPLGKSEIKINPIWFSASVFLVLFLIGTSPLWIHLAIPDSDWIFTRRAGIQAIDGYQSEDALFYFLGYRPLVIDGASSGIYVGPFGLGATILSLFLPLAFGLSIGIFYRFRSGTLIDIRKQSKNLEKEFSSALFQLGNRLGDGIPAEIAFEKVATTMEDTISGKFFQLVSTNIRKLGMGLEQAIFDSKKGALAYYPSNLIESSMKVLVQAAKKGPLVASQALINISEYIKEMHRVDERLKDLMADIVSDMKSQISFLTPAIAGIVVGITSMITKILGSLGESLTQLQVGEGGQNFGDNLLGLFGTGIPTFWFQAIVGVYVVQIIFILTILINGIENGSDKLMEQYMLGRHLVSTTITYCIIAGIVIILFNVIAGSIITPFAGSIGGG